MWDYGKPEARIGDEAVSEGRGNPEFADGGAEG